MDIPGLRELYESDDPGFRMFVDAVVNRTVEEHKRAHDEG